MNPPKQYPDWLVGVRTAKGKLMGFISGIPVMLKTHKLENKMAEINFLCVHKKLRAVRLAPVLIKEVTRRVNLRNIFTAVYTSGTLLPRPFTECRYWHRNINVKKLIDCKFSFLPQGRTMGIHRKLLKIPAEPTVAVRPLERKDLGQVQQLYSAYNNKKSVSFIFNKKELAHLLLPREKVMSCYVVEDPETGNITDFFSFYSLPSSCFTHPDHDKINACFSYYNVATSMPIKDLINNAIIMAQKEGYDVYNCLDLMDNSEVFEDLKFGKGSGTLQYYLYNFAVNDLPANETAIVLV